MTDVDRSTGTPLVPQVTGLVVTPVTSGFDLHWDASPNADLYCYEIERNDGKTFRTTATVLQDRHELIPYTLYSWKVVARADKKRSIPAVTNKFQF